MANKNLTKRMFQDLENEEIRVGQEVILDIANEGKYFGKISLINTARNRVQVKDVIFCRTNAKLSGVKQFYRPEIKSIEIVSDNIVAQVEETETVEKDSTCKFVIDNKQFKKIQTLISNHTKIDSVIGKEYDEALNDISEQDFVGLNVEALENGSITLIGVSTNIKVYVFDIKTIGRINDRLKGILESNEPVKVVHDASSVAGNLYQGLGFKLKGIFDTMIALKSLTKSVTTLRECITEHMIFPSDFMDETNYIEDASFKSCNHKTAILLIIKDCITEQLLKHAYTSFNQNLNYCRSKNSEDAQLFLRKEDSIKQQYNLIPPFKLNLN